MKACQTHWDELREEVKKNGLEEYVAKTGEKLVDKLKDESEQGGSLETFDPLMGAYMSVMAQYANNVGIAGFLGDLCPFCECDKARAGLARNWIEGSVADQLRRAKDLGLVIQ